MYRRVELPTGEDEPVFYWDTAGRFYSDAALATRTDPPLLIVELVDEIEDDDDDD